MKLGLDADEWVQWRKRPPVMKGSSMSDDNMEKEAFNKSAVLGAGGTVAGGRLMDMMKRTFEPDKVYLDTQEILGPKTSAGQLFVASAITQMAPGDPMTNIMLNLRSANAFESMLHSTGGDLYLSVATKEEAMSARAVLLQFAEKVGEFVDASLKAIEELAELREKREKTESERLESLLGGMQGSAPNEKTAEL